MTRVKGSRQKWTEEQFERRRIKTEETAKLPVSYHRKKEIYANMTDDFERY